LIGLSQARDKALENKRAAQRGEDPLAEKRRTKAANLKRVTFAEAAKSACAELTPGWKSAKEPKAFMSSLTTHVFQHFGDVDVGEVKSAEIRRAIMKCRKKVPNMATKVQHRILSVFRFAVAEGLRADNPATADALALPKPDRKVSHNRALPYCEVASALETVSKSGAWVSTKLALHFAVLTACRSGEVRGARWTEIDLPSATWTIPGERMKMGREHKVPLSLRALEILDEAAAQRDGELVFPSATGKKLSDNTLSKLLREQGIAGTVHGFRASFRTWTQEQTDVSEEVAEAALAHVEKNKTVAAYARSDLFEKRKSLMEAWATFLNQAKNQKF
jgi:integrase